MAYAISNTLKNNSTKTVDWKFSLLKQTWQKYTKNATSNDKKTILRVRISFRVLGEEKMWLLGLFSLTWLLIGTSKFHIYIYIYLLQLIELANVYIKEGRYFDFVGFRSFEGTMNKIDEQCFDPLGSTKLLNL